MATKAIPNIRKVNRAQAPKAPEKRPPGRPKKEATEKLEQFSIRLPPKLKFGLELLARAQHRSLSQAVEWALQVGLNSHTVNQDGMSVAALVDKAWSAPSDFLRARTIFDAAPSLCDFDDYSACVLTERSRERAETFDFAGGIEESQFLDALFTQFASLYWSEIKKEAIEQSTMGMDLTNKYLFSALGIQQLLGDNIVQKLRRAIEKKGASPISRSDVKVDWSKVSF